MSNRYGRSALWGAALAAVLTLLGGCQALGVGRHGGAAPALADAPVNRQSVDFGAELLASGRDALAAGRTIDAIEAFMAAKAYSAQMPAAYNGLAVAYSRLGRADLTERYFLTAIAFAPEEPRYRTNLARFYERAAPPLAAGAALTPSPAEQGVPAAKKPAPNAPANPPVRRPARILAAGITVEAPAPTIRRVSRGEVFIRSAAHPAPTSGIAAAGRAPIGATGRSRPAPYPVRITLAAPAPAVRAAVPAYPIRIPLAD